MKFFIVLSFVLSFCFSQISLAGDCKVQLRRFWKPFKVEKSLYEKVKKAINELKEKHPDDYDSLFCSSRDGRDNPYSIPYFQSKEGIRIPLGMFNLFNENIKLQMKDFRDLIHSGLKFDEAFSAQYLLSYIDTEIRMYMEDLEEEPALKKKIKAENKGRKFTLEGLFFKASKFPKMYFIFEQVLDEQEKY